MFRLTSQAGLVRRAALSVGRRGVASQEKYELPKFLPDPEKEFGIHVPKSYVPPQYRDPYKKYDDQQNRVNFGEKIHPWHDYIDMWSPDHYHTVRDDVALKRFLAFFSCIAAFGFTIKYFDLYPDRPSMPREYPYEGLYKELGGREGEQKMFQANPDKEYK